MRILKYLSQSGQPFSSLRFELRQNQPSKPKTKCKETQLLTLPPPNFSPLLPTKKSPPSIISRSVDINELKHKTWSSQRTVLLLLEVNFNPSSSNFHVL